MTCFGSMVAWCKSSRKVTLVWFQQPKTGGGTSLLTRTRINRVKASRASCSMDIPIVLQGFVPFGHAVQPLLIKWSSLVLFVAQMYIYIYAQKVKNYGKHSVFAVFYEKNTQKVAHGGGPDHIYIYLSLSLSLSLSL